MTISRCVIFKAAFNTSSDSWLEILNQRLAVGRCLSEGLSVTASRVWLKSHIDSNWLRSLRGHLHIFFHKPTISIDHVTDSAYLHRCILSREISVWWLGRGSICNINLKNLIWIALKTMSHWYDFIVYNG